jgi:hypothetical protein
LNRQRPSTATLINFQDCHDALTELRGIGAKSVDFKGLLDTDLTIRKNLQLPPVRPVIGFASVDTRVGPDDPQDRFARAVENAGILLERIDYRDAYVNPPGPFVNQGGTDDGTRPRGVQTLAAAVSFAMGALATREKPSVVLIAGRFDHAYAIRHFAEQGGTVCLAFWRSCIDQRFFSRDALSGIKFVDLEDYPAVMGGVDVKGGGRPGKRPGVSALF